MSKLRLLVEDRYGETYTGRMARRFLEDTANAALITVPVVGLSMRQRLQWLLEHVPVQSAWLGVDRRRADPKRSIYKEALMAVRSRGVARAARRQARALREAEVPRLPRTQGGRIRFVPYRDLPAELGYTVVAESPNGAITVRGATPVATPSPQPERD